MTFPDFLRAEVLRLGDGVSSRGEALAAIVLDVSDRQVRRWMAGDLPNKVTEVGARQLLLAAKSK